MENDLDNIHAYIKDLFPDAVAVRIFVNSEGIEVNPEYRTNTNGYSMRNINGKFVKTGGDSE